jgi:hypothetical protein
MYSAVRLDGQSRAKATEWQRGLVYTAKSEIPSPLLPDHEYRITASFKQRITGGKAFTAYEKLYRRAARMVNTRIAELTCPGDEPLHTWIVCQGWGTFGDSYNIAIAFPGTSQITGTAPVPRFALLKSCGTHARRTTRTFPTATRTN